MVATLRQVWQTHFERNTGGPPRWRDGAELPPVGERIQSPYDPQMHYSTKRGLEWSGYKVHVTETCDPRSAHITHVGTRPAMEPDISATATIHKRLATRGLLPAKHFVDSGYVDADLLLSSRRDHGVSLEGPVRKISTWASRAGHGYDLPNFKIDWDRTQVICPQGKVSVSWTPGADSAGQPRIHARFGRAGCRNCKARSLCTPAKAARRSIYFHPRAEYEALNNARARMNDPAWKKQYRARAGVEGTLSRRHATKPLRRFCKDRSTASLCSSWHQCCTGRWVAGTKASCQDTHLSLCSIGTADILNSPTVSSFCARPKLPFEKNQAVCALVISGVARKSIAYRLSSSPKNFA
jgi:transposase